MKLLIVVIFVMLGVGCSNKVKRHPSSADISIAATVVRNVHNAKNSNNPKLRFQLDEDLSIMCKDGSQETFTYLTVFNEVSFPQGLAENERVQLTIPQGRIYCPPSSFIGMDNAVAETLSVSTDN